MNKEDFVSPVRDYNGDKVMAISPDGLVFVSRDPVAARMAVENDYERGSDTARRIKVSLRNGKLTKTEYCFGTTGELVGVSIKDIDRKTLLKELQGPKGRDVARSVLFDKPFYEKTGRDNER